ncbi:hypothetical protein PL11_005360 [Lentilactobacillus curieae]|uniref:Uncharacterized protein n=1 Tax=Lentilactobacillus curieae TaxID=1138822 RepID=A0A1S6QL57_9LACO|nr:hypothetical protein [Lentilactobacillus curieae]AQW22331.1 hypothetical protein PL11_005360 [Lentilactobacillus curieae]
MYETLRSAQIDEMLINVYQKHTDIVYTGTIQYLSSNDLIMNTYNDFGIQDGSVYLKLAIIAQVETDSYDLANMKDRIAFDEANRVLLDEDVDMPINMSDNLFERVITNLQNTNSMGLIVTLEDNQLKYSEGLIEKYSGGTISFRTIDKFNFEKSELKLIDLSDIVGIEFSGSELVLLGDSLPIIREEDHISPVEVTSSEQIPDEIMKLRDNGGFSIITTTDDRKYFYVGTIISANPVEFVMQVVDMSGRFGGYVWMRYDDVAKVVLDSDYLKVMKNFVTNNRVGGKFVLPGLNDQRAFDDNDNLLTYLIDQSIKHHKLIRFELVDGTDVIGFPNAIDQRTGSLVIWLLDFDEVTNSVKRTVGLEEIKEMAFDYYKAFLLENHID